MKICKIVIKRKYRSRRVNGTELGPRNLVFQSAQSGKLHPDACWAVLPREQRSLHSLPGDGGICWPVTGCGKDIYQATQEVKFITAFCSLFLPDPPGLCLMLRTDGAEEFQVAADGVSFSLIFFFFLRTLNPAVNHSCFPASDACWFPDARTKYLILQL